MKEEEVLDRIVEYKPEAKEALVRKRTYNALIDHFVALVVMVLPIILGLRPDALPDVDVYTLEKDIAFLFLLGIVFSFVPLLMGFLYYFIMEYFFKGKTLGKMVTGTRAVMAKDHSLMPVKTVFWRSMIRFIPCEQFTFLGELDSGFHDNWTKTTVIEDQNWWEGN